MKFGCIRELTKVPSLKVCLFWNLFFAKQTFLELVVLNEYCQKLLYLRFSKVPKVFKHHILTESTWNAKAGCLKEVTLSILRHQQDTKNKWCCHLVSQQKCTQYLKFLKPLGRKWLFSEKLPLIVFACFCTILQSSKAQKKVGNVSA